MSLWQFMWFANGLSVCACVRSRGRVSAFVSLFCCTFAVLSIRIMISSRPAWRLLIETWNSVEQAPSDLRSRCVFFLSAPFAQRINIQSVAIVNKMPISPSFGYWALSRSRSRSLSQMYYSPHPNDQNWAHFLYLFPPPRPPPSPLPLSWKTFYMRILARYSPQCARSIIGIWPFARSVSTSSGNLFVSILLFVECFIHVEESVEYGWR